MMNTKHYLKTREYLSQVKEAVQKVEMLKNRLGKIEPRSACECSHLPGGSSGCGQSLAARFSQAGQDRHGSLL